MHTTISQTQENKHQSAATQAPQKQNHGASGFQFEDHRPEATTQRKLNEIANNSPQVKQLSAFQRTPYQKAKASIGNTGVIQKTTYTDMNTMWDKEFKNETWLKTSDVDLLANYDEASKQLPYVDFLNTPGADPHVDPNVVREDGRSTIKFDRKNPKKWDPDFYVASIIHELIHIANLRKYKKHTKSSDLKFANFHLPEPQGKVGENGLAPNQDQSLKNQLKVLYQNWEDLDKTADDDSKKGLFTEPIFKHIKDRIQYGGGNALIETDTVLFDISYYLAKKELTKTDTYKFAKRMLKEATDRRNTPGQKARRVDAQAYWYELWKW